MDEGMNVKTVEALGNGCHTPQKSELSVLLGMHTVQDSVVHLDNVK
jgi:hypothetical protein